MESQPPVEKKSNNKTIIVIGVILLVCVCAVVVVVAALAIFGSTIQNVSNQVSEGVGYTGLADIQLRADVLKTISAYESSQSNCSDISLSGGQVLSAPDQSGDGSWSETWQINVCGAAHPYTITFTPSPQGGTDFSAKPMNP